VLNADTSLKKENKPYGKRTEANFGVFLAVKQCEGVLNAGIVTMRFLGAKDAENGILKMN
jgi:hypothetical protein